MIEAVVFDMDGLLDREQVLDDNVGRMAGYYERGEVPILAGALRSD